MPGVSLQAKVARAIIAVLATIFGLLALIAFVTVMLARNTDDIRDVTYEAFQEEVVANRVVRIELDSPQNGGGDGEVSWRSGGLTYRAIAPTPLPEPDLDLLEAHDVVIVDANPSGDRAPVGQWLPRAILVAALVATWLYLRRRTTKRAQGAEPAA